MPSHPSRARGTSHLEFFSEELELEVLDCASVAGVSYLAIQFPEGVGARMVEHRFDRWGTFYWERPIPEYEPFYSGFQRCPARILEQLDEPDRLYPPHEAARAQRWRENCWKRIKARAEKDSVSKGQVVIFAQALRFRGGEAFFELIWQGGNTFEPARSHRFHLYTVRRWREREYRVLSLEEWKAEQESRPSALAEILSPSS